MANNKVLVIGSGGREHALCWKLASSPKVETVFVAPGNADIFKERKVSVADVKVNDFQAVAIFCKQNSIGLVVVGPEDLLANGMADELAKKAILCFGPTKAASQIEANKNWAKAFMDRHQIPTPRWNSFPDFEHAKQFFNKSSALPTVVVKASCLTADKGIEVAAGNQEEALKAVQLIIAKSTFRLATDMVVVEELLAGEEFSVLAFSDGTNVKLMLPAQDHKRLMTEDKGPNTQGIGADYPYQLMTEQEMQHFKEQVLQKAVDGLKSEGTPFVGVIYASLMMTKDGPKVLEFNCRFGDLETQVILPLLETDLFDIMMACCTGRLAETDLKWKNHLNGISAVVATSGGNPSPLTGGQNSLDPTITSDAMRQLLQRVARVEQTQQEMKRHVAAVQQRAELEQGASGSSSNKRRMVDEKDLPRTAVLATRKEMYVNSSFDSVAKGLMIEIFGVCKGNLLVPFYSFYKAIAILCLESSQVPAEFRSSLSILMRLCGKDVSLFLSAILEDFQQIGNSMTDVLKVTSNPTTAVSERFITHLKALGIMFEMNHAESIPPEISSFAAVSLICNRWPIFEQQNTFHGGLFSCEDGTSMKVDMMSSSTFSAQCGSWENATYLVVPLKDDETLSMLLLLPNEGVKIQDMEKKFGYLFMHSLMKRTTRKNVQLKLPKMTATTNMNGIDLFKLVSAMFQSQGMKIPSMAGWNHALRFSQVTKVVFSEGVNAQGRPYKRSTPAIKPDLVVNCNRPFVFVAYNKTDYALLGGRVSRPQQEQLQPLQMPITEQQDPIQRPLQPRQSLLPNMNVAGSVVSGVTGAAEGSQVGGTIMNAQSTTINLQPGSTLHIHGNMQVTPKRD